jgi:alkyl hydroperoxide reductase subunit D
MLPRRRSSANATFCVASHYALLKNEQGMSALQLRDVGRIAAVVNAAAQVLAIEGR